MGNCKKHKTIDLTTNQRKKYIFYRSFFNNLMDHACQCTETWCWCRGSIFNDSLADFKFIADDNEKRLIEEILGRDEH